MNRPCHAIATAKHIPMYFRLRSNHVVNGAGNNVCSADIATTTAMNGTAQRTEKPIICNTPGAVDRSTVDISTTMTMDIGTATSQNSLHWLMALFCSTAFRSMLMYFGYLYRKRAATSSFSHPMLDRSILPIGQEDILIFDGRIWTCLSPRKRAFEMGSILP